MSRLKEVQGVGEGQLQMTADAKLTREYEKFGPKRVTIAGSSSSKGKTHLALLAGSVSILVTIAGPSSSKGKDTRGLRKLKGPTDGYFRV
ncbi:hypothetical protein Scep_011939 [Stephania cephalantha]|uniref:Uncharacterized protein n=1 Tax=Stephania cephalantha TaxID=152367 RepID=A0AAP0JE15_9MAGN